MATIKGDVNCRVTSVSRTGKVDVTLHGWEGFEAMWKTLVVPDLEL